MLITTLDHFFIYCTNVSRDIQYVSACVYMHAFVDALNGPGPCVLNLAFFFYIVMEMVRSVSSTTIQMYSSYLSTDGILANFTRSVELLMNVELDRV